MLVHRRGVPTFQSGGDGGTYLPADGGGSNYLSADGGAYFGLGVPTRYPPARVCAFPAKVGTPPPARVGTLPLYPPAKVGTPLQGSCPSYRTAQQVHATRRAVSLLPSRRRTFLLFNEAFTFQQESVILVKI